MESEKYILKPIYVSAKPAKYVFFRWMLDVQLTKTVHALYRNVVIIFIPAGKFLPLWPNWSTNIPAKFQNILLHPSSYVKL